ncbi:hypothetical protein ACIRBX_34000 [Kitasatospora sp. NPDC096147]|uniref:hypothetical protein n=1 Tax=Kitasatospora sp. NPDC096147 TaxID=3364093 RepID=UPI0038212986
MGFPAREPRHGAEPDARICSPAGKPPLQLSAQRDPAVTAPFVRTRVLGPEPEELRRGLEELTAYKKT